jgi:hypothetical protein
VRFPFCQKNNYLENVRDQLVRGLARHLSGDACRSEA